MEWKVACGADQIRLPRLDREEPYFRGDQFYPPEIAEEINRRLEKHFPCKDAVHDVSRHLRLAGTINQKPEYKDLVPFRAKLIEEM